MSPSLLPVVVSVPSSPAPALWMLLMLVFVVPAYVIYMFMGDIRMKKPLLATVLVIMCGIVLMPMSYLILRGFQ